MLYLIFIGVITAWVVAFANYPEIDRLSDEITASFWDRWSVLFLFFTLSVLIVFSIVVNYLMTFGLISMPQTKIGYYCHMAVLLTSPFTLLLSINVLDDSSWHLYHHHIDEWLD